MHYSVEFAATRHMSRDFGFEFERELLSSRVYQNASRNLFQQDERSSDDKLSLSVTTSEAAGDTGVLYDKESRRAWLVPMDSLTPELHLGLLTYQISDDRSQYWVDAYVNNSLVRVFPDNGSALNLISEDYVHRNGLVVEDDTTTIIRLPDGRLVDSFGSLTALFRFAEESQTFTITFTVLSGCVHDFVLSGTFLRATQTFTRFKHRIRHSLSNSPTPIRVCFHGTPQQQVIGSINGHIVFASPDTGSNVNLIAESRAIAMGLEISLDPEKTVLKFVDGSHVMVCGIVRHAAWRFGRASNQLHSFKSAYGATSSASLPREWEHGRDATQGHTFICDFYVVKDLTVPVILSSSLLYGTNAFTACAEHFQPYVESDTSVAVVTKPLKERLSKRCKRGNKATCKMR